MDFSTSDKSAREQKKLRVDFLTNQKPSEAGFDLRGEADKQGSELGFLIYGICLACFDEGQANKSARGMPWHQEPMKDVISCDKLRGAANEH